MNIKDRIESFVPYNEQEEVDKKYYLEFIDGFEDVLTRDNLFGHFSSSALVLNKARTKILAVYHLILDGWIYPGGHADGEEDLLSVAIREVEEETGLKAKPIVNDIFAIQSAPTKGHVKRGKYVPAHIHFDVLYLLEADDELELAFREDESKGVKWLDITDINNENIVPFAKENMLKAIEKLKDNNINI